MHAQTFEIFLPLRNYFSKQQGGKIDCFGRAKLIAATVFPLWKAVGGVFAKDNFHTAVFDAGRTIVPSLEDKSLLL